MRLWISVIFLFLFSMPSFAAHIYKCRDSSGKILLTDSPCSSFGAETLDSRRVGDPAPSNGRSGVGGLTMDQRRRVQSLDARLRADEQRYQAARDAAPPDDRGSRKARCRRFDEIASQQLGSRYFDASAARDEWFELRCQLP